MFWQRNGIIRAIRTVIFLVLLFLWNPLWWDIIHNDHIIEDNKSNNPSNIYNSGNIPKIGTWILDELQIYEQMHGAAEDWNAKYKTACSWRQDLCDKVTYKNISDKNKYYYQSIMNLLFSRLDSFSQKSISTTIKYITIDGDKWDRRWYAWRTKLYINPKDIASYREFLEVFTHELGHIVDLWVIKWSDWAELDKNYTEFGDPSFAIDDKSLDFYKISWSNENTSYEDTSYKDFVSWYGMSNPFEDFAECQNMYINHKDVFAKMAESSSELQSKYDYMNELYNDKYIQNDDKNVTKLGKNPTRRPWDTTRIR